MEKIRFRNHYSVVVEKLFSFFVIIALLIIQNIGNFSEELDQIKAGEIAGTALPVVLILLGITVLVVVVQSVVWAKTWIIIDEQTITMERSTMNRVKNTIGLKNVSNVNIEQNIFEKVFGTCKVKLDTASLSTANQTDVTILLKKQRAEKLKNLILDRVEADSDKQETTADEGDETQPKTRTRRDVHYDIEANSNDILVHGFCSISLATVWVLIGTIAASIGAFMEFGKSMEGGLAAMAANFIVIVGIIYTCLRSLLGGFITYYHFKAGREGDKIYVHYGLFKTFDYAIPVDKINAVIIHQPFIARIMKKYIVEVVNVGMGDESAESGAHIILAAGRTQLEEQLQTLLPEFAGMDIDHVARQPRAVLLLKAVKTVILSAILIIGGVTVKSLIADMPLWIPIAVIAVLIVFGIILGILNYYTEGTRFEEDKIITATGSFGRDYTIMKRENVQYLSIYTNVIGDHFGMARGSANLLAALANQTKLIPYCDAEVLEHWAAAYIEKENVLC